MERISSKPVEKKDEPGYISSSSGFSSLPPSAGSLSSPSLTPPSSNSSLQDSDSSEGAEHSKVRILYSAVIASPKTKNIIMSA